MKNSKNILITLAALVVITALYRIIPNRPMGFAPQIAIAIFSGALFLKNKKWAFAMPLLSMFISDVLYEVLYNANLSTIKGFYVGQATNYALFTLMTFFGFIITKLNFTRVTVAAVTAPTTFFILSNFFVWFSGTGGLQRPQTFSGLMMCYNDALPFYPNNLVSTILFSACFFGTWAIARVSRARTALAK